MISTSQPSPAQPSLQRPNGTPVWAVAAKTVIFMTAALPTADQRGDKLGTRATLSRVKYAVVPSYVSRD